jgi:rhodanese-related sulfurtransferase
MAKTTAYPTLAALLIFAGCSFQQPDYVETIAPAELNRLMQAQDVFLVDVHTPEQRHIKGTDLFVPYDAIAKHQDQFPQDKNTPIYLYCEAGPMGNAAARALHDLGYRHLVNLEGGARAWESSGLTFE